MSGNRRVGRSKSRAGRGSGTVTPTLFSELSIDDKKMTMATLIEDKIDGKGNGSASTAKAGSVASKRLKSNTEESIVARSSSEHDDATSANGNAVLASSREPGWVYLFGSGDCGQLGMGEEVDSRKRPTLHPFLKDKEIVSVCAGGLHNLALTRDGQVYSWGCNDEKALGHDAPEYSVGLVQGALTGKQVVQVACGDSISAALTSEGHVYAWGTFRDSRGVLGFDESTEMQVQPKLVEALLRYRVVHLAAGANHLAALTSNDKIYSWGCGEQGQLGRRILERHRHKGLKPQSVTQSYKRKVNSKYVKLVCGSYHTLALNQTNNVFVWGLNNYGQLGLGDYKERMTAELISPRYFNHEPVIDLGAGEHHSIALTAQGNIFCFGRGDSGQLGVESIEEEDDVEDVEDGDNNEKGQGGEGKSHGSNGKEHTTRPIPLTSLSNVELIASGGNHNLAKTRDGRLFSWGYGGMLQLGNGEEEDELTPFQVKFDQSPNIIDIQGGGQHSVLLVRPTTTTSVPNNNT